jgi:hypothetical protein
LDKISSKTERIIESHNVHSVLNMLAIFKEFSSKFKDGFMLSKQLRGDKQKNQDANVTIPFPSRSLPPIYTSSFLLRSTVITNLI